MDTTWQSRQLSDTRKASLVCAQRLYFASVSREFVSIIWVTTKFHNDHSLGRHKNTKSVVWNWSIWISHLQYFGNLWDWSQTFRRKHLSQQHNHVLLGSQWPVEGRSASKSLSCSEFLVLFVLSTPSMILKHQPDDLARSFTYVYILLPHLFTAIYATSILIL